MAIRRGEIITRIIENGLTHNIDPSNRVTYPRSGIKVYNTIDTDITGSFINDVAYNNESPDNFQFGLDGIDDMIKLNSRIAESNTQTDITINQLSELVSQISFENIKNSKLKNILNLQSRLNYAEQEYLEINSVISELISCKEDMFDLYLSKKSEDLENINEDDEAKLDEFEILLENYQSQLNEDINHIKKLVKEVEIKLKLADISLADFRNKIALYNTQISIYSITISFASFF